MAGQDMQHVLIFGAGIAGLLVAQGLKKSGIRFSIFEAEQSATLDRQRKWGMSLQWALPLLKEVLPEDLLGRLQADASVDPHYSFPETGNSMPVYNAETGELLKDIPLVKMLRVSRQRMRSLCAEGVDVQYGKALATVEISKANPSTVMATLTDGTTVTGTLSIGADGATSTLRKAAFAAYGQPEAGEEVPSGYGGVNMHVCYKDAETARFLRKSLSPIMGIGMHPRGYWLWLSVQDVPDPELPEDWVFQLQWTFKLGPETSTLATLELATLKQEVLNFAEPFKTAWRKIPDGTKVPGNKVSVWQPVPTPREWEGKVALTGDAAHAMSFHRGQGMNHGIADAVKLTEVLAAVQKGEKNQKDAILEYEAEMIKRAGEEVVIGKMNTELVHDFPKLMESPFMQRGGDRNK